MLTILGLRDQNLVMRSMSVRGIAIVASMRLEIARLAINIFLVVRSTYTDTKMYDVTAQFQPNTKFDWNPPHFTNPHKLVKHFQTT